MASVEQGEKPQEVEDDGNCDSGDVFGAENDNLFLEGVLDFEKGYSCIKPDVEDVTKDQGDIHVLTSPLDWESGNGLLEAGVSHVASESRATEIPIETEKSVDLALDSEIVTSSIKAYAKSLEQIDDQSNASEIATSEFNDVPQETEFSQDVTQNSHTEFPDESFQDDFQNAAEISFEPQTVDYVIEKGADADLADENLSNSSEHATNTSIVVTSIEFEEAGANLLREITAVTNKSADENVISGTGKLTTTELVDVAPQIPFQLQIPSSTQFSETLPEIKEEIIIHPAVIAALSSPDENLPIESAQLSVIQTQLLNSEEAGMSASGMTVEKVEKWVEKENSVQDNLKNISLIKLRAMYKQKLDSKKNELERGKSMIKREDVEISGSIRAR